MGTSKNKVRRDKDPRAFSELVLAALVKGQGSDVSVELLLHVLELNYFVSLFIEAELAGIVIVEILFIHFWIPFFLSLSGFLLGNTISH